MAQLIRLHQSDILVLLEARADRRIAKKRFLKVFNNLELKTPIGTVFYNILMSRVSDMKKLEDLKVMIRVLIAKYSLVRLLSKHYEEKAYREYYIGECNSLQHIQEDFEQLSTQLQHFLA